MTTMTDQPTGPDVPHVLTAMHAVMCDILAISKDRRTTGGQTFNFRGVDDVVNAVGPALRSHGLLMKPEVLHMERRSYQAKGGTSMTETLVKMAFTFTSIEDGSRERVGPVWGESADASDKSATKAQSVAERVALLQAFIIPTDQPDPDETQFENAGPIRASKEQTDEIYEHIQSVYAQGPERIDVIKAFKAEFGLLSELPEDKVDPAWTWLVNRELAMAKDEIPDDERKPPPGVDEETGEIAGGPKPPPRPVHHTPDSDEEPF